MAYLSELHLLSLAGTITIAGLGMLIYRKISSPKPSRKLVLFFSIIAWLGLLFLPLAILIFSSADLGNARPPDWTGIYLGGTAFFAIATAAGLGYSISTRIEDLIRLRWPKSGPLAAFIGILPAALFPAEVVWLWLLILTGVPL